MFLPSKPPNVLDYLAIGAHPDDIELGAGGFIHRLTTEFNANVHFLILTEGLRGFPSGITYESETRRREALSAAELLGVPHQNVAICSYNDCELHLNGHEAIREIEGRLYGADRKRDSTLC